MNFAPKLLTTLSILGSLQLGQALGTEKDSFEGETKKHLQSSPIVDTNDQEDARMAFALGNKTSDELRDIIKKNKKKLVKLKTLSHKEKSRLCMKVAFAYHHLDNFCRAKEYYSKGFHLLNNLENEEKKWIEQKLSILHKESKEKALSYMKKANGYYRTYLDSKDHQEESDTDHKIFRNARGCYLKGLFLLDKEAKNKEGKLIHQEIIELCKKRLEKILFQKKRALTLGILGLSYFTLKNDDEALKVFNQALESKEISKERKKSIIRVIDKINKRKNKQIV